MKTRTRGKGGGHTPHVYGRTAPYYVSGGGWGGVGCEGGRRRAHGGGGGGGGWGVGADRQLPHAPPTTMVYKTQPVAHKSALWP
jgi:hypothetical protein